MSNIGFDEMLINNLKEENKQLKQQLAESEEQLEWANKQITEAENQLDKQASIHYGHIKEVVSKIDQDKISFAIDKLEKIKDKFREIYDKNRKHHLSVVKCYELVDEQIASLKKGVE